jgi:hypothetical protein
MPVAKPSIDWFHSHQQLVFSTALLSFPDRQLSAQKRRKLTFKALAPVTAVFANFSDVRLN